MVIPEQVHHAVDKKVQYLARYARLILICLPFSLLKTNDNVADQCRSPVVLKVCKQVVMSFELREAENVRDAVFSPVFAVEFEYSVIVNYCDACLRLVFKALSVDLS